MTRKRLVKLAIAALTLFVYFSMFHIATLLENDSITLLEALACLAFIIPLLIVDCKVLDIYTECTRRSRTSRISNLNTRRYHS